MNIEIKINDVDRTNEVDVSTIYKNERMGAISTLDFRMTKEAISDIPELNQEVKLTVDSNILFYGIIVKMEKRQEIGTLSRLFISCNDFGHNLNRYIVSARYNKKTVNEIIEDLVSKYASGDFTTTNVDCDIEVETIVFDKITLTESLKRLASLTNYNWYVDYNKDINFFSRTDNVAPFNLTDTNGNYIYSSLDVVEDLSQLRNKVLIRGGEIEGNNRSEIFSGDGTREYFNLSNKFGTLPTVEVDGVGKTVGIDFLDQEEAFDCFWDYNNRYVRFVVAPAVGSDNVVIDGKPLYPVIIQVQDDDSVDKYGVAEFFKEDRKIRSLEEGKQFATAELEAYKEEIFEGSFETYQHGLKAGQIININSDAIGVDEDFLIQSIALTMQSKNRFIYSVKLATLKTIGILEYLISQLLIGNRIIKEDFDEILVKPFFVSEILEIDETHARETGETMPLEEMQIAEDMESSDNEPVYVYAPYVPTMLTDTKVKGIFNISKWQ